MPKPSTIASCGPGRLTRPSSKGLIQPGGKILLQIFCRCRTRNSAVQFVVDRSKSGARIANSAAAIGQPPKSGYSGMAQPCVVLRYARRPRSPPDAAVTPAATAPREPPAGRPPRRRSSAQVSQDRCRPHHGDPCLGPSAFTPASSAISVVIFPCLGGAGANNHSSRAAGPSRPAMLVERQLKANEGASRSGCVGRCCPAACKLFAWA